MNTMLWSLFFSLLAILIYILQPNLRQSALRKVLGITLFLELFYMAGYYFYSWPFPSPFVILQLVTIVGLGFALGAVFSLVWPIPLLKGFERVMRTLLISIPALGFGIGLQLLMQGNDPTQALYIIFAFAAWFGSDYNISIEKVLVPAKT